MLKKLLDKIPYPPEAPILAITLYYLLLFGLGTLLLWQFPALREMVSGERLAALGREGKLLPFTSPEASIPGQWLSWEFALSLGASMIGSFLLMVPSSWVYMATRRRKGFDQGLVQTMVVLAVAVAGVVVVVRNSLALAFSLAGIVGAVRFRNSLKDPQDTLYIFLAIGVGLAAGVEALVAGAVFSLVFNYLVLLMYHTDYGLCELGRAAGHLLYTEAAPPAPGKPRDFTSVILVRARHPDDAKAALGPILNRETKRWKLAETEVKPRETMLKYLARLRKGVVPSDLEDAILAVGGKAVIGAKIH